jgi:hypothetical protein
MQKVTVLLIIGLVAGGLVAFLNKTHPSKLSSQTPSAIIKPAIIVKTMQMQTAEKYFNAFNECTKKPPTEATGQVTVYCETHNEFATGKLGENLKKQLAPVICAQNPPKSVSAIRSTDINENQALVTLSEDFGANKINVTYQMQRESGQWKVASILCPK